MVIIKRYPNRKLYDTHAKQYITLERIGELIRQSCEVQVIDHASGEDLTALTLTQVILEQEKRRSGLISNHLLTSLIRSSSERLLMLQHSLHSSADLIDLDELENCLRERQLPTRADIQRLSDQLDELAAKIERLSNQADK